MNYQIPLEPNKYYHIFNHAVGTDNLFRTHDNYLYFLRKYALYIEPIAKTYAYVLMPNHFHLLIQVRDEVNLQLHYQHLKKQDTLMHEDCQRFIMQQFSNLCNAYTKAFNKMYKRKGALFIDFLKRIEIPNESYFQNVAHYIHHNGVHHGFCKRPEEWLYSSFQSLLTQKKTLLQRNAILDWFGGIEDFIKYHNHSVKYERSLILE